MANLDFYATRADHEAIVRYLLESTDVVLFEKDSQRGRDLRRFASFEDLASAFEIGADPAGTGYAVTLGLWSPSVEPSPPIERVSLNPAYCDGQTFRFTIAGGGTIQLYLGGIGARGVSRSHYGHFEEAGARKWGRAEGVDWDALKKISNKIQYHIRGRLSVARVFGFQVLPEACRYARSGHDLIGTAGAPLQPRRPDVDRGS